MTSTRRFLICLTVCWSLRTAPAQQPQAFPLICRGGTRLPNFELTESALIYLFIKSPDKANANQPPGSCAWVDRPLNAGEPQMLQQDIPPSTPIKLQYDTSRRLRLIQVGGAEFGWLSSLSSADHWWTFIVYNAGPNMHVVKSIESKAP